MGHTGVTQFLRILRLANRHQLTVIPHATIGLGVFLAASIHASAAHTAVECHEYQHSILEKNLRYVDTDLRCDAGTYRIPSGHGHGVVPQIDRLAEYIEA